MVIALGKVVMILLIMQKTQRAGTNCGDGSRKNLITLILVQ